MRSCAQWNSNFFTGQFACDVFVDFQIRAHNTVVVVGIADGHVDDLKVLPGRGRHHEGRHALADGQLHVARGHRRRHRRAGVEADPVDVDAHRLFVHALDLGVLEWHRPFEEIGHGNLAQVPAGLDRSARADQRKRCHGALQRSVHHHLSSPCSSFPRRGAAHMLIRRAYFGARRAHQNESAFIALQNHSALALCKSGNWPYRAARKKGNLMRRYTSPGRLARLRSTQS